MQACLENTALPLLTSNSLPRYGERPYPAESAPAWTIRITRPASTDRNELASELRGVPKAALRQVFGKIMGTRLWQLNRAIATTAPVSTIAAPAAAIPARPSAPIVATPRIADTEISSGLLGYLCAEASATLRDRKRLAKSISLTVIYADGKSESVRQPLPLAANEATALETAARLAMRSMRSNTFVSLKLDLTAIPA
jgi:nucleotidyltransferase/DNA polymerase involved in DNA repair